MTQHDFNNQIMDLLGRLGEQVESHESTLKVLKE